MEIRHSAFVWAIPLLAVLFIYDPFRTASDYPALWTLRASVVPDKLWPVFVPFAAGFSAWAGSREGRRNVGDLLATTARPAWTRQLCSLAGTLAWVLAAFGAGVAVLVRQHRAGGDLGRAAGLAGRGRRRGADRGLRARVHPRGAVPGRFTAPIVAVGISVLALAVFSRAVSEGGASVFALSPDGIVPGNDAGVFYPVAPDVSIVQVMFFAGCTLGAVGLLGLSPRTGRRRLARRPRSRERGRGAAARRGDRRLRGRHRPGRAGFGLAATARVSPVTGGIEVPPCTTAPPTSRSRTPRSARMLPAASRSACTRPTRAT